MVDLNFTSLVMADLCYGQFDTKPIFSTVGMRLIFYVHFRILLKILTLFERDPDYDNTEAILAKMEEYNQPPGELPMYTDCHCVIRPHSAKDMYASSSEPTVESYGDSDTDSDNEGMYTVSVLRITFSHWL